PERGLRLEPVDQELARLEGGLPVRGCGDHQHDALARLEPTIAVDNEQGFEFPAAPRLGLDFAELFFRHAGIMLEGHRADAIRARRVAHHAEEGDDATDLVSTFGQPRDLGTDVEVLALHADHGLPSSDRWKERHFVTGPDRMVPRHVILIDRDAYH